MTPPTLAQTFEFLSLPALNLLVAEQVMGATWFPVEEDAAVFHPGVTHLLQMNPKNWILAERASGGAIRFLAPLIDDDPENGMAYATQLVPAFAVVDRMQVLGWDFIMAKDPLLIVRFTLHSEESREMAIKVGAVAPTAFPSSMPYGIGTDSSGSLPRAICLAALTALENARQSAARRTAP